MGMQEYEEAVRVMEARPDLREFAGPRAEPLVRKAEVRLGFRFPPTYRRFLLEYGAGNFGSAEIFGVIAENFDRSAVPDGVWYTLKERQAVGLPSNLMVIYNDGMGNLGCLETIPEADHEGAVVLYRPGLQASSQPREILATDFGRFLLDLVESEASV
jgi:SUKH superfamily protein